MLIVECLNAVYGTMVAALLYYKKIVKSLTKQFFKLNLYDGCVANKIVNGKQITICFHVDDYKISHECTQRWEMQRSSGSEQSMRVYLRMAQGL